MANSDGFLDSLKQQKLPSHQFSFGPISVFCLTFSLGILCIGIGISLTQAARSIKQFEFDYTNETDATVIFSVNLTEFKEDVFIYYELINFPQLHYSMRHSYDFEHFANADYSYICAGENFGHRTAKEYMKQLYNESSSFAWLDAMTPKSRSENESIPVPCGQRARYFFNDKIRIFDLNGNPVNFTNKDITWTNHKVYFKNNATYAPEDPCFTFINWSSNPLKRYVAPDLWKEHICDMENAMENEDFIVWMVPAYAKTFRKLWRKFILNEQEKGSEYAEGLGRFSDNFTIEIDNIWPNWPNRFDIDGNILFRKKIVISSVNWAGGKNNFLGNAYLIVGVIIIIIGCGLALMQSFYPSYLIHEKKEEIRWRKSH